jgi:hypothetical protein
MPNSPVIGARIPPEIEQEARRRDPALADLDGPTLVRVGLLVLAGYGIAEALSKARMRSGPKPRGAAGQ